MHLHAYVKLGVVSGLPRVQETHRCARNIITSLDRTNTIINQKKGPNHATYQISWQQLHRALKQWPKIGPEGGLLSWPLFISDEFFALLRSGDWTARVLFLHYGTAMRLMRDRWYVRDYWGHQLVVAILETLHEVPPEWMDTISWIRNTTEGSPLVRPPGQYNSPGVELHSASFNSPPGQEDSTEAVIHFQG